MNLLLVMTTYSRGNRDLTRKRYCDAPKSEVMLRCLYSVVDALRRVPPNVELVLLNDNDDIEYLETMRLILAQMPHPSHIELVKPAQPIVSPTSRDRQVVPAVMLARYRYGLEHGKGGLVYFLEDDYLHDEDAIAKMLDAWTLFSKNMGRPVAIDGFNDPYRYYIPQNIELTRVVYGPERHWRLTYCSTATFMIHHDLVERYWKYFEAFGSIPTTNTSEDETVNKLWQVENIPLFMPIPSLSLHLQYETEKDPYIDWKKWWDRADYRKKLM